MLNQVPVYLGREPDRLIGTAEILDDKHILIGLMRDILVKAIEELGELNQIRGIYVDLMLMPVAEANNGPDRY